MDAANDLRTNQRCCKVHAKEPDRIMSKANVGSLQLHFQVCTSHSKIPHGCIAVWTQMTKNSN